MSLAGFWSGLLKEGKVTVAGETSNFSREDEQALLEIFRQYHADDSLEMPYEAPRFCEEAAVWSAEYFYSAVQLTVLRDAGEEIIQQKLTGYKDKITPEVIYSADLGFRYLPSLLDLAKGLAPADPLVKELKATAAHWPFSSVGMELDEPVNNDYIFSDTSLTYAYIDRIIKYKDMKRVSDERVANYIREALGGHLDTFWPEFPGIAGASETQDKKIVNGINQ